MTTLRCDPTTGEWVILAPGRAARPQRVHRGGRESLPAFDAACPFCPGNEHRTPPEIERTPAGHGWQVRVVPNLFPAAGPGAEPGPDAGGLYRSAGGGGAHEVIVESPRHDARMDEMPAAEVATALGVWRDRYRALAALPGIRGVTVFKNFGSGAGTSLAHAHSQVVAVPVDTPAWVRARAQAARYAGETGRNLYEDLVEAERGGERRIADRGRFLAFVPFAAPAPFETWLAPTFGQASFDQVGDADLEDLAALVRDALRALRAACDDPDFNVVVDSAPPGAEHEDLFRWHIRILPRVTTAAGFELGSGMGINTVTPEEAAARLRSAVALAPAVRRPHGSEADRQRDDEEAAG